MDDGLEDPKHEGYYVTQVRHRSHTVEFQFAGQRAQMGKAPATKPGCDPWGLHNGRKGPVHTTCPFSPRVCHSVPLYPHK